ncbi:hypothetical protein AVEN_104666-1 [Araneus ventricosus]|uniref:Uncharacterized protein n=1 Tax=Araneus ventricosus TaxID=182803 RepID=A0A4Y2BBP1_ARAVE|nr:hypothetical protein AVEN_104666-1 [Araneus ventricosus]
MTTVEAVANATDSIRECQATKVCQTLQFFLHLLAELFYRCRYFSIPAFLSIDGHSSRYAPYPATLCLSYKITACVAAFVLGFVVHFILHFIFEVIVVNFQYLIFPEYYPSFHVANFVRNCASSTSSIAIASSFSDVSSMAAPDRFADNAFDFQTTYSKPNRGLRHSIETVRAAMKASLYTKKQHLPILQAFIAW